VLADRSEAEAAPPPTAGDVVSLVPLPEVLSELVSSGPSSQTVGRNYDRLLATLGSELSILRDVPVEDISRSSSPLLAEAVTRLRAGRVIRDAGYDGEYGTIHLFEEAELRQLTNGGSLFGDAPVTRRGKRRAPEAPPATDVAPVPSPKPAIAASDTASVSKAGLLSSLDEDQRRAAEIVDGPLAIVAGPGSGKTRTLAHRFAYLVSERGVPAASCLAITFTRRAAGEMQERLARLLMDGSAVAVHTFHSLGLSILREHGEVVNVARELRVATEAERVAMLAEALSVSSTRAESLLRTISKAKRTGHAPDDKAADALRVYQEKLARRQWVDFDDLVGLAVRIVSTDAAVAAQYRARFQRIAVDEFQDVDDQQYRLLTLLAPANGHLCVIGDPHQAIYGFRGADASCFDRFAADYPSAPVVRLTRNYRSTGTIVTASSQVLARSTQAAPISSLVREMHERITIHAAPTDRAEAEFVVAAIERLLGGHSLFSIDSGRAAGATQSALGFSDFAVLARTSAQLEALREAFARSGLPFQVHAHDPLAAQPAVQAIMREWEGGLAAAPDERIAAQLGAAADRLPKDAVDVATKELALQRLRSLAESCGDDRARFLDLVALAADADFRDPRATAISLMTLHAAKGLEFAVVFIVGLEDGVLPLRWSELDEAATDEERRLLYVGMTRAKDRLLLSRADERLWRGQRRPMRASPFLLDIEHQLVEHQRPEARPNVPNERQMKLL
jgi:superfamily I DNA/RNA helicase